MSTVGFSLLNKNAFFFFWFGESFFFFFLNQEWVLKFVLILLCIFLDDTVVSYHHFSVNVVDNCAHYQLLSN